MGMGKILVADDEPDLLEIITLELELAGFEAVPVNSGNEAIGVLSDNSKKIDAVLSDIRMPHGSGTDLLDDMMLKNQETTPLIFMSGFSDISRSDALAKGACAYFSKPTDMNKVIEKLKQVLQPQKERWESSAKMAPNSSLVSLQFNSFTEALEYGKFSVGRGGFYLECETSLKVGDTVPFKIISLEEGSISGQGSVKWQNVNDQTKQIYGIEIDFLDDETSREAFESLLIAYKPKAYIPNKSGH